MEIASGLIQLKPDTQEKVELWRSTLSSRLKECLTTLRDEGVEIESWFQIEIQGQQYLLWYMRAESIQKAFEHAQTFKHDIDKFHFNILNQIAEHHIRAEPVLDLSVDV